ncbi:hypothetical protein C8A03DRAFT_36315 [Achaetomium macrosporum]|uniref:Uncharacterized protein n=1 Tax=Achaetomium macrosporum TaxID=79813 RepID=A0AAN7HC37_9PEZI|nr:hypothetical protein C8A03DRAFT_36315 [Achaetomium macrosporum]
MYETVPEFPQRLPPAEPKCRTPPAYDLPNDTASSTRNRSAYPTSRLNGIVKRYFIQEGCNLLRRFKQNLAQCAPRDHARLWQGFERGAWEAVGGWKVMSGKQWTLYPKEDEVIYVWRTVWEGVDANRLGTSGNVPTDSKESW